MLEVAAEARDEATVDLACAIANPAAFIKNIRERYGVKAPTQDFAGNWSALAAMLGDKKASHNMQMRQAARRISAQVRKRKGQHG